MKAVGRALLFAVSAALIGACDANFRFDQKDASGSCATDSDCPLATLHCDLTSGSCVPCTDDSACTTTGFPRCDTALHLCVECGSSQDCQAGWQCVETHRCVPPCSSPADCSASVPNCNEITGVCYACNDLVPCATGVCDDDSGRCVECKYDSQCSSGYCQRALGKCVGCVLSSQCPASAPICDPASWSCIN